MRFGRSRKTPASSAAALRLRTQLEILANYFGGLMLAALLVFPGTGAEAAFDHDHGAFRKKLTGDLGLPAPGDDIMEFGFLSTIAIFILADAVRGHRKSGDGCAARSPPEFRILGYSAYKNYPVKIHFWLEIIVRPGDKKSINPSE